MDIRGTCGVGLGMVESVFQFLTGEQWTALGTMLAAVSLGAQGLGWVRMRRRIEFINDQPDRYLRRETIGREGDVREIEAHLGTPGDDGRARIVVIAGGPGAGKTTLARYFLHRKQDTYAHTLHLRSETPERLEADLADFALRHHGAAASKELSVRAETGLAIIAEGAAEARWLVVLDNAPDQATVSRYMPQGRHLDIVVTSRNPDWRGPGLVVMRPSRLTTEDAVALLRAEAGRDSAQFDELAHALDHLPLALVQAGLWVRAHPGARVGDYLSALDRHLDARDMTEAEEVGYPHAAGGAIRLTCKDMSRDARLLAQVLAGFEPDAIDDTAFRRLGEARPWHVGLAWLVGLVPFRLWRICRSPKRRMAAFRELELKSLLEPGESEGTMRMHRVTGMILRRIAGPRRVEKRMTGLLALTFPRNTLASAAWSDCARLMPHVQRLLEQEDLGMTSYASTIAQSSYLEAVGDYLSRTGDHALTRTGDHLNGARIFAHMLDMIRASPFGKGTALALAEFRYARSLVWTGDYADAYELLLQAIDRLEAENPGHVWLGAMYTVLAEATQLREPGEASSQRALKLRQKALALRLESFGRVSPEVGESLHNLGHTRVSLGQVNAGIRLLEKSKRVFEASLSDPDDYRLAYAPGEIGRVLLEYGYAYEALPHLRQALELRRQAYAGTPEHVEVGIAATNLASALLVAANFAPDRLRYYFEVLALLGEFDPLSVWSDERMDQAAEACWLRLTEGHSRFALDPAYPRAVIPLGLLPPERGDFTALPFPGVSG